MKNKSMSKSELAWMYSPQMSQSSALNRLARWIKGDSELLRDLQAAGYQEKQRILTARQVSILIEHLGNPETDPEILTFM